MAGNLHKFGVVLFKKSEKKLDGRKVAAALDTIAKRAVPTAMQLRGWKFLGFLPHQDNLEPAGKGTDLTYKVKMRIVCRTKRPRTPERIQSELERVGKNAAAAGRQGGWFVEGGTAGDNSGLPTTYADVEVPKEWQKHFTELYDRDDQIKIVLSAVAAGMRTNWDDRFHTVLAGPPAGGKTEILRCLKRMVGDDAILEYDATATTMAGAIKDLDSRKELPRIMVIEELEKVDENSLRWMLAVLDHRGEIRKVNFRQQVHRSTKLLCLATVNDYALFKKMMYGALASRFPNHVLCPKPSFAVIRRILEREVARVKGNKRWIDATMRFVKSRKVHDPRRAIAVCLCGRDDLLTGKFQGMLDRTSTGFYGKYGVTKDTE